MAEVPAAITSSTDFDWVASGAAAIAAGVTPKPAMTLTLSLTMSSWARRLVLSGTAPSSLRITSIFLPATVAPCCCMYSFTPASICLPVEACGPVIGRMRPIFTLSCASALPANSVASASDAIPETEFLSDIPDSSGILLVKGRMRTAPPHVARYGYFAARSGRSLDACVLGVRLALRVDDLLELAENVHAGKHLLETRVRLALFPDRGDEFAVLELDAVHGDIDLGHVDLVVLAVAEIVVERLVGAVVADVAEERAERPVVVERQREREDRARRHLRHDAHVHGNSELRMDRPLHRIAIGNRLAGLVLEQVDGVGGVMPQEVVGPTARVTRRVDVLAAEEIGLHVHLLDLELTLLDALVNPLMTGVEAAHVPAHRHDAGLLGDLHQLFGVFDAVGDRDLDQHMLAGAHHLFALPEMHLGRRGENERIGAFDALGQVAGVMGNAVFLGDLCGGVLIAADQRGDLYAGNALHRVEMLLAKGALAGYANLHRFPLLAIR